MMESWFVISLLACFILFCGLLLASKITGFSASASSLFVVSIITILVGSIPIIGSVAGIISQYFMLKKINPEGQVIVTMLVSILTTIPVLLLVFSIFD